eukprot:CFRG3475T1
MASSSLYKESRAEIWTKAINIYPHIVAELAKKKKDPKKLIRLDKWVSTELPENIKTRGYVHVTKDEVSMLTTWKLMRGKWRPRLQNLVDSNSENDVVRASTEAAKCVLPESTKTAITALTTLSGIGPATASAILCALSDGAVPFMSDEAVMCVLNQTKIDYNIKTYLKYVDLMQAKSKELNKLFEDTTWTPHMIEKALWATEKATILGVDITQYDVSTECPSVASTTSSKRFTGKSASQSAIVKEKLKARENTPTETKTTSTSAPAKVPPGTEKSVLLRRSKRGRAVEAINLNSGGEAKKKRI